MWPLTLCKCNRLTLPATEKQQKKIPTGLSSCRKHLENGNNGDLRNSLGLAGGILGAWRFGVCLKKFSTKKWWEGNFLKFQGNLGWWNTGVSKNNGTPKSSHFNRVFHYKPSILGYPYFWKHSYYNLPKNGVSKFCGFDFMGWDWKSPWNFSSRKKTPKKNSWGARLCLKKHEFLKLGTAKKRWITPWKFNISPLKIYHPKKKGLSSSPMIFQGFQLAVKLWGFFRSRKNGWSRNWCFGIWGRFCITTLNVPARKWTDSNG